MVSALGSILGARAHVLVSWQLLSSSDDISFASLHLHLVWKGNYCGCCSWIVLSVGEWLVLVAILRLVNLDSTKLARNLIHGQTMVLEATSTLGAMSANILVLVWHLPSVHQIVIWLAIYIVVSMIRWWVTLREEMSTASATVGVLTTWLSTSGVLANVQHSFWMLMNHVLALRGIIILLGFVSADWWNVAGGILRRDTSILFARVIILSV